MKGKSKESDSNSVPLLNDAENSEGFVYYDLENPVSKSTSKWGSDIVESYNYRSAPTFSPPATMGSLATMGSVEIKVSEEVNEEKSKLGSVGVKVGGEEVIDDESESDSAAACRICLENHGEDLIAPCECKGTQQFVHRSCLDHWRSVKEGFAFAHCTTCRSQFHLTVNFLEGSCWRNVKFRMFVARDSLLLFLALQTIIAMLGGISYLFDIDGNFRKSIDHDWDHIFSNHPVFFYYCIGALLFFALLGIFGLVLQCYSCCEHHDLYNHNNSYNYNRPRLAESDPIYCCNGPCFFAIPDFNCHSSDDSCAGVLIFVFVLVVIFAVIGIFYGIFAGTIGLQRIWQRHYHILTKTELTKEYVVEDLHGHYTPPKLDREHADRLRMLQLL